MGFGHEDRGRICLIIRGAHAENLPSGEVNREEVAIISSAAKPSRSFSTLGGVVVVATALVVLIAALMLVLVLKKRSLVNPVPLLPVFSPDSETTELMQVIS